MFIEKNNTKLVNHLRLRDILERLKISRATWYRWMQVGFAPKGKKLGSYIRVWPEPELIALMERMEEAKK